MEKEGVIYQLRGNGKYLYTYYIGSTINFTKRLSYHKSPSNRTMSRVFDGDFTYEILEKVKYIEIIELRKRERFWIENTIGCINRSIPTRTKKEYKGIYYIKNKDKVLNQCKQNYLNNKDKVLKRVNNYRQTHKDEIREKKRLYREAHKDEIREKKRLYREEHKDELKEKKKKYYEQNRDAIREKQNQSRKLKKLTIKWLKEIII